MRDIGIPILIKDHGRRTSEVGTARTVATRGITTQISACLPISTEIRGVKYEPPLGCNAKGEGDDALGYTRIGYADRG